MAALDRNIRPDTTAAILLAAGSSRRFGSDKLSANIDGQTVLEKSAAVLQSTDCFTYAGIVSAGRNNHAEIMMRNGAIPLENKKAASGISTSIGLGITWAKAQGARAVLITLGDMPYLPIGHFQDLFLLANNELEVAFTKCEERRMPPVIFGSRWFGDLLSRVGDSGARSLLRDLPEKVGLEADPRILADIDVPADINTT